MRAVFGSTVLLMQPEVALAVLVHRMVLQVFLSGYVSNRIVQINIECAHLKQDAENIEQSRAAIVLAEKHQYWQERIEVGKQGGKTLFGWLLEQPQQDLLELVAYCVATSINTVSSRENAPSDEVAALMTSLNLEMADWWEATAENYFSHVPKDRILAIVAEAVSPQQAQSMNGLKKVDLARQAEQALSGSRWVPDNFKTVKRQEEQKP